MPYGADAQATPAIATGETGEDARLLLRRVLSSGPVSQMAGSGLLPTGSVTLLLGDVEGSTVLWERNAEVMPAAVAALNRVVDDAVGRHGGVRPVEQGEGDSFVAAFSRPTDAILAAIDIQTGVADGMLRLRVGVHTGEIQLRDERNYMGPTINRTARVRELGHGGQILLSRPTYELVVDELPNDVGVVDLGVHRLRDLGRPEQVYQLRHPALEEVFPPLRSLDAVANNLPAQLTSFVGRHAELAALVDGLASARLVTLTGSGGCGKTRMALQAAAVTSDRYSGGVWFCDLSAVTQDDDVAQTLAVALSLRDLPGLNSTERVIRQLERATALVVLDNCEQVIGGAAALADAVLQACGNVTVLATSREQLGIAGEVAWRVPSMACPAKGVPTPVEGLAAFEAVQLFIDRARLGRPNFVVTADNAVAVAAICGRLDGIPLAIELAAARVRVLTVEQIEAGLSDRFRLLGSGSRTAMPRQQTLLASVGWSHDLLTADQKLLFRRLSVFAGDFDLDAAEAVGSGEGIATSAVLEVLAQLVDRSLVIVGDASGVALYRLLETVRQFGRDRLFDSGEAADVRTRHLEHYERWARTLIDGVEQSGDDSSILARTDRARDDVVAALGWALTDRRTERGLRLVASMWPYWAVRGHYAEGRGWAEALDAAVTEPVDPAVHAGALLAVVWLAEGQGDLVAQTVAADRALAYAREAGDRQLIGRCLGKIGYPISFFEYDQGVAHLREAIDIAREERDAYSLRSSLNYLGFFTFVHDSCIDAQPLLEESIDVGHSGYTFNTGPPTAWLGLLKVFRGEVDAGKVMLEDVRVRFDATANPFWLALTETFLAFVHNAQGNRDRAVELCRSAVEAATRIGAPQVAACAHAFLASVLVQQQDMEAAEASVAEAVALAPQLGPWFGNYFTVMALTARTRARAIQGHLEAAQAAVDEAVEAAEAHPCPWPMGLAQLTAGGVARRAGDPARADAAAQRALATLAAAGITVIIPEVLDLLAALDADQGGDVDAARLATAATARRQEMGTRPLGWAMSDDALTASRARLGEEAYAAAAAEGSALSLDDTVRWVTRGRAGRKRPAHGWPSLTPTELEVVKLVAEGLSNPEIAARLFVSRRTVTTHLSHVFTKLGLTSRSQVAAAAVHQGL